MHANLLCYCKYDKHIDWYDGDDADMMMVLE